MRHTWDGHSRQPRYHASLGAPTLAPCRCFLLRNCDESYVDIGVYKVHDLDLSVLTFSIVLNDTEGVNSQKGDVQARTYLHCINTSRTQTRSKLRETMLSLKNINIFFTRRVSLLRTPSVAENGVTCMMVPFDDTSVLYVDKTKIWQLPLLLHD
jgi:hypothetical protein